MKKIFLILLSITISSCGNNHSDPKEEEKSKSQIQIVEFEPEIPTSPQTLTSLLEVYITIYGYMENFDCVKTEEKYYDLYSIPFEEGVEVRIMKQASDGTMSIEHSSDVSNDGLLSVNIEVTDHEGKKLTLTQLSNLLNWLATHKCDN